MQTQKQTGNAVGQMTMDIHKVLYKRLVKRKLLGSEQKGELCVLSLNGQSKTTKLFAYVMNSNLAVQISLFFSEIDYWALLR
jgi:hypothetical protein